MKIERLAEFLSFKHKVAVDASSLELEVRKQIRMLWKYPHELFPIIDFCANTDINKSTAKSNEEKKAFEGYIFCKKIVTAIDYLQSKWDIISLGKIKDIILTITSLLSNGLERGPQFADVSELIFQAIPIKKKHDIKLRDRQFNKMKTGFSRINSICIDMLKNLHILELAVPEKFIEQNDSINDPNFPARFTPEITPLSESDIISFIRLHGPEYGINDIDEWEIAIRDDLDLKKQMTTVINALNRGHSPKDAADAKMQIAEILKRHEERKSNNSQIFDN